MPKSDRARSLERRARWCARRPPAFGPTPDHAKCVTQTQLYDAQELWMDRVPSDTMLAALRHLSVVVPAAVHIALQGIVVSSKASKTRGRAT